MTSIKRANYGIDAPNVVLRFLVMGIVGIGLGITKGLNFVFVIPSYSLRATK